MIGLLLATCLGQSLTITVDPDDSTPLAVRAMAMHDKGIGASPIGHAAADQLGDQVIVGSGIYLVEQERFWQPPPDVWLWWARWRIGGHVWPLEIDLLAEPERPVTPPIDPTPDPEPEPGPMPEPDTAPEPEPPGAATIRLFAGTEEVRPDDVLDGNAEVPLVLEIRTHRQAEMRVSKSRGACELEELEPGTWRLTVTPKQEHIGRTRVVRVDAHLSDERVERFEFGIRVQ